MSRASRQSQKHCRPGRPWGPAARIRAGLRVALRRRYSFAALRVLRRSVRAASASHAAAQLGREPYSSQSAELAEAYAAALKRLFRRWPLLDLDDRRAIP